jgi:hypothetical protein
MPRKKQISIEPQALQPIEEPMEETMEQPAPPPVKRTPVKSSERIMPEMSLKPDEPKKGIHVSGFMLLFLATAVAAGAVYYWPEYGFRDFLADNNASSTYHPVAHKPVDAGTNITPTPPSGTADKTFASTTYNFEVTYPATATVTGSFDQEKSMTITDSATPNSDLLLEFVPQPIANVRGDIASSFKVISAKDIKFNGYDAREILVGVEDIGPSSIILISRPGGTFKIVHPVGSYDKVLASFKFTK